MGTISILIATSQAIASGEVSKIKHGFSTSQEFELRKHARQEGRRYCDPMVLTYQAERMPEQIRLKVRSSQMSQRLLIFYSVWQYLILFCSLSRLVELILNSWLFMRSLPATFQAFYPVMTCLNQLVFLLNQWRYKALILEEILLGYHMMEATHRFFYCIAATGMAHWWCGSHLWEVHFWPGTAPASNSTCTGHEPTDPGHT